VGLNARVFDGGGEQLRTRTKKGGVGGGPPQNAGKVAGERLGHDLGSGEGPLSQERKRSAVTMTVVSAACPCPE